MAIHGGGRILAAIAREVGVHHATVRRVLLAKGADYAEMVRRPSIVDPYRGFIADKINRMSKRMKGIGG